MLDDSASPSEPTLLRKLGEGVRAEVFLARSGGEPVAAKVYRPTTARASVELELEALARAAHPHCLRLIDVDSTGASGAPLAVLERLPRGSLAMLLDRRGTLRLGEAITILAPIAEAVDALHSAGVVHGALGPSAVLFRENGAPVLARFGHAELVDGRTAASRAEAAGVIADREALCGLVRTVLTRVSSLDEGAADAIVGTDEHADGLGAAVVARLFAMSGAEAVAFDATPMAVPLPAPSARSLDSRDPRGSALRSLAGLAERLAPAGVVGRVARAVDDLRRVRRPVWVIAGVGLAALLATVIAVSAGPSVGPVAPSVAPVTSSPSAMAPDARSGEEPLPALAALLAVRASCFTALSTDCLDGVDQSGSAAEAADRASIAELRGGGGQAATLDATGARVARSLTLGDSVLVTLAHPAPHATSAVLIMRTADGWRIRDYLTE